MNGDGKTLKINSKVYTDSIVVKDTITALKHYIRELSSNKKTISAINTGDPDFLKSSHSSNLKKARRNVNRQGYVLSNGALLVEQSNSRLKNADHRFYLAVNTAKSAGKFLSKWKVRSLYDFEPFSKGFITNIPLAKGFVLQLPDGLSHYLTQIGIAKDFTYTSTWQELWK